MKGKWTKILLIINMFLCLFGVQKLSESSDNVTAATSNPGTIYVDSSQCTGWNDSNWNDVYLYAYGGGLSQNAAFPGVKMTKVSNVSGKSHLFKLTINSGYTSMVLSNGSDGNWNKTADITLNTSTNYYVTKKATDSQNRRTYSSYSVNYFNKSNIYFDFRKDGVKWGTPYMYMWFDDGNDLTEKNYEFKSGASFSNSSQVPTVSTISGESNLYKVTTFTGPYKNLILSNAGDNSSQTKTFNISNLGTYNCLQVDVLGSGFVINAKNLYKVSANDTTMTKTHYVSLLSEIPTPSKPNYTFKGWFTSSTGGTQVTSLSSDCTIYAQFERSNCDLTISDNGSQTTKSVKYNSTIQSLIDNGTIAPKGKTGYTFSHWSLSNNGEKMSYSAAVTSNMTIYAVYTLNKHTITFKVNGETVSTKVYNYGDLIVPPSNPENYQTTDKVYTFKEWHDSKGSPLTSGQTVTTDMVYTAVFTGSPRKYEVTYYYNGKNTKLNLAYGSGIIANAPAEAKIDGKKISWYFDESFTIPVTGDSSVDSQRSVYAKYVDLTYASVYLDYSEFTTWSFTTSHFYVYSSTSDANNTWPGKTASAFDCGSITSLGNNLYQISLDETYDKIIVNNGVATNGRQAVTISLTVNSSGERIKYVKLTDGTRKGTTADGESVVGRDLNLIKTETNLDNLLKTQKAPISGTNDMYRFTFGVKDTNKYGLSFIFITSGNESTIRYWNFSTDSKLNEVRLGTTLYDATKGYSGYYSLTIRENGSFDLLNYDRFVVLACYKDTNGVNVLKAVEYKINSDGTLTRVV